MIEVKRPWGLMPSNWSGPGRKGFEVWVPPVTPCVCASCGRLADTPDRLWHPWGCSVLIRLCAQLLAGCDLSEWRVRAHEFARAVMDPWHPAAVHWRRVMEEPEPPVPSATPDLIPEGDGLWEVTFTDNSRPFSETLLKAQKFEALNHAFGEAGWMTCAAPLVRLLDWDRYCREESP